MITVKAAPVLTRALEETMCVAGVRVDGVPAWIRLHPVPFRDLGQDEAFKKYQTITADVFRPATDRRPESWTPISGSIRLGPTLDTSDRWMARKDLISRLGEFDMCDLIEVNRAGSGPHTPSLAVVRPAGPPSLHITPRDESQIQTWKARAEAIAGRPSLFVSDRATKPEFEVVPWRFRYRYRCNARQCRGHDQTIVDWEVVALWRRVRSRPDWKDQMRAKFEEAMWASRPSVLFVGNMEQHPQSFLVLGVFWPPEGPIQGKLPLE